MLHQCFGRLLVQSTCQQLLAGHTSQGVGWKQVQLGSGCHMSMLSSVTGEPPWAVHIDQAAGEEACEQQGTCCQCGQCHPQDHHHQVSAQIRSTRQVEEQLMQQVFLGGKAHGKAAQPITAVSLQDRAHHAVQDQAASTMQGMNPCRRGLGVMYYLHQPRRRF